MPQPIFIITEKYISKNASALSEKTNSVEEQIDRLKSCSDFSIKECASLIYAKIWVCATVSNELKIAQKETAYKTHHNHVLHENVSENQYVPANQTDI